MSDSNLIKDGVVLLYLKEPHFSNASALTLWMSHCSLSAIYSTSFTEHNHTVIGYWFIFFWVLLLYFCRQSSYKTWSLDLGEQHSTNFTCAVQSSWVSNISFSLTPLLLGHFIRLKMLWTKKCPISTLKMGFIGLKNRNLFYFFKRTHTLTHARARTHAFTLVRTPNRRPNRMTCWMGLCCGNDKAIEWSCTLVTLAAGPVGWLKESNQYTVSLPLPFFLFVQTN